MSKQTVISARLDTETIALIDDIVAAQGRSRAWFVAQAVREHAQREAEFLTFVQEGVDAIASGDWISHDEMKQWIANRRTEHKAKHAAT